MIDYKPLNHFLADNKFPLPNKNTLFASLSKANIFSTFDLKPGFWQLKINEEKRHVIGFYYSNHHCQWMVMPFNLKTVPSWFQKAITRIFHPILESTLIYIDDILLFSKVAYSHSRLLSQFTNLMKQFGVMLS